MIVIEDYCVRELWASEKCIVVVEGNIYDSERRKMCNIAKDDLRDV